MAVEQISHAGVYMNSKFTCFELLMILGDLEIGSFLNSYRNKDECQYPCVEF